MSSPLAEVFICCSVLVASFGIEYWNLYPVYNMGFISFPSLLFSSWKRTRQMSCIGTIYWRHGVLPMVLVPWCSDYHYTQLHSTKSEPWFWAGSNPTSSVSEICNGENLSQWSHLEIRLNAFRWSTILQKQFTIIFHYQQTVEINVDWHRWFHSALPTSTLHRELLIMDPSFCSCVSVNCLN